jgi:hypothetical protein
LRQTAQIRHRQSNVQDSRRRNRRIQWADGVVRRRSRQKRSAREAIEAVEAFDTIDATGWAESGACRARPHRRTQTARRRPHADRAPARRARGGRRSNKEIAAALFVTPKTIGLSRLYAKLGVHSRTEMVRPVTQAGVAVDDGDDPTCMPHVYTANTADNAFVDPGGGHIPRAASTQALAA